MDDAIISKEKNNDNKGIALVSFGIMTLIAAISGATYAFFQATKEVTFSGGSAYVANPLTLTVTDVTASSVGTGATAKKLIPQLDEDIQTAVTGSANGACVDSYGSAVCKVYSIRIENKTDTNFYLKGSLEFVIYPTGTASMPNLKWAKGTSTTAGFPSTTAGPFYSSFDTFISNTASTTQTTDLTDTFFIAANDKTVTKNSVTYDDNETFYIVVWISETGAVQSDNGSFKGIVSFDGFSDDGRNLQGVTSTIRS